MKKSIDTLVMKLSSYYLMVFGLILFSLSIAALFIFLGFRLNKHWLIIFGPLLSFTPVIVVRLKLDLVAKKAKVNFSDESVEITTEDALNERLVYSDIKYFSMSKYDVDKASTISFISGNGIKRRYIFFKQLDDEENILNNMLHYFSSYNNGKIQKEKIQILPSFFLTRPGKIFVAITGLIILAFIIMQVLYRPKTIPVSLFAVLGAYLQVKAIQSNNQKILKKYRDENF